jgi:hypothetical protein
MTPCPVTSATGVITSPIRVITSATGVITMRRSG